jgi:hypothetical protein
LTEIAERELERMVERRAQEDGERNTLNAYLDREARRRAEQLRKEAREEWRRFHRNMSRLHLNLAKEHRAKARRLEG